MYLYLFYICVYLLPMTSVNRLSKSL